MDITHLIAHPEELSQETLYDLRRLVAVYPTYHAARILLLQNLFLLHDPSFDQELRRAALLVPDRRVLFAMTQTLTQMTKAREKQPQSDPVQQEESEEKTQVMPAEQEEGPTKPKRPVKKYVKKDTTARLLDDFLDNTPAPLAKKRIKADPTTDYMAFLMQQEDMVMADGLSEEDKKAASRLDSLIDSFIASQEDGIKLSDDPMIPEGMEELPADNNETETEATSVEAETAPTETEATNVEAETAPTEAEATNAEAETAPTEAEATNAEAETAPTETEAANAEAETAPTEAETTSSAGELSETLAQIYIKQQKYDRAIEVLSKIKSPKAGTSNPYLEDQLRFLQKLAAINSRNKEK